MAGSCLYQSFDAFTRKTGIQIRTLNGDATVGYTGGFGSVSASYTWQLAHRTALLFQFDRTEPGP